LILSGNYPAEMRAINLDTDWFYRKGGVAFYWVMDNVLNSINRFATLLVMRKFPEKLGRFAADGMAYLGLLVVLPFWTAAGVDKNVQARRRARFIERMRLGTLPIGLIALSVIICLGIFCFFNEWL
ncbi:MAG: Na(+)/H(+) antiporter subunit D, partial [Planctomycetota bacterium]